MAFAETYHVISVGVTGRPVARALGLILIGLFCVLTRAVAAPPVTLTFPVTADQREPFSREIVAEVITPTQTILKLPAFYVGRNQFAVRARAEEAGLYRLGRVTEQAGERQVEIAINSAQQLTVAREAISALQPVHIDTKAPDRFVLANGTPYVPIGTNLAWAPADGLAWYEDALKQFSAAHLNWARVWMANWGGLNLDWAVEGQTSPAPGMIDLEVAAKWDALVANAEDAGVYLQVVLQHHGQYASRVNPNWNENPWNAKNPGGFLRSPTDFFTSAKAIQLTKRKYRYIVARWGYSPAVLAWELFNEVHWVDAIRTDRREAAVANWHATMAAHLRSLDVYRHLVTTSTEDLRSAIFDSMDYLQPHLYATNMLAAARRFDVRPDVLSRPVFYGEMGNDHMRVTAEQKAAAVEHIPVVWASVMGEGRYPAQIWEGDKILAAARVGELGAVARFLAGTRLAEREGLKEFSAVVESTETVPLRLEGSENWRRRSPLELTVSMDGKELTDYGVIPRMLVGSRRSVADGYPDRITLHVSYAAAATATLRIANAGSKGASVRVELDGVKAAEHRWTALPKHVSETDAAVARPAALRFPISAGQHTLVIANTGGADWIDFEALDLGVETSAVAAIGKRSTDFVALWLWQRNGIFAITPSKPVSGVVKIDDMPAGTWKAVWWDTLKGQPQEETEIHHSGGPLRLTFKSLVRHTAVVLARVS